MTYAVPSLRSKQATLEVEVAKTDLSLTKAFRYSCPMSDLSLKIPS